MQQPYNGIKAFSDGKKWKRTWQFSTAYNN